MSARILLVGFGRRGHQWRHAVAARSDCKLVGCVDPDDQAASAAAAVGLDAWANLEDALASAQPTAVIIATPPALHSAHALTCLRVGLPVLVEKPLALTLGDAVAVADAAEAAGAPALVGHNFRYRALERTIRRALAAGRIGELRTTTIAAARPAISATYEPSSQAPLWDLGVHHLDLLRGRLGGMPDSVQAHVFRSAGGLTFTLHLEWDGGATADYWLREGASVYHHAEWMEGHNGALRTVDGRVWLVTAERRPKRLRAVRGPNPEQVLLEALLSGNGVAVMDARESLGTIAMLEAAASSLELERPVELAESFGDRGGIKA